MTEIKTRGKPRHCVICGASLSLRYQGNHQTCGDAFCQAVLKLNPRLRDLSRVQKQKMPAYGFKKGKSRGSIAKQIAKSTSMLASDTERHKAIAKGFELDSSNWQIRDKHLSRDRRGKASPELQENVWGRLSRRTVAWKCVAHGYGKASLTIRLNPNQTVSEYIRKELAADSGSEQLFEIFYAWRCTCPMRTHVTYETVDDLPQEVGYHHACISCGCSPLEVVVDE